MNIGEASRRSYLPAKTIRYYEDIALLKPKRAENGYREYSDNDVHCLRFLQRSRSLGFTIEECRLLISLYRDEHRLSANVKVIVKDKVCEIDRKIEMLGSLRQTLSILAENCNGDDKANCPILDDLVGENGQ